MRTTPLSTLSSAYKINIAGLLIAAAGIVIQILAGVDYPVVPPGLLILLAAAGIVAFGPWRWTPLVGLAVPVFLLIGGAIAAAVNGANTWDPNDFGPFIGTLIQTLGEIVALLGAVRAIRERR